MRLLFIYFYKTKGTFKEGTIIELSKKYSVKHNGKFKFTLTKNSSFQDDFYGNNIDIGAIIGENGTGKSVLINSLRDGSNDYSLAVYEKWDGEFFYEGDFKGKISLEDGNIEPLDDISFVYYSPIMDMFDFKKKNFTNISDKEMFLENDSENITISKNLALIDNRDIQKFFEMGERTTKINISQLKLNSAMSFFEKVEKSLEKEYINLLPIMIKIELENSKNSKFIKELTSLIPTKKNKRLFRL